MKLGCGGGVLSICDSLPNFPYLTSADQVIPVWRGKSLVEDNRGVFLSPEELPGEMSRETTFLGLTEEDRRPLFAAHLKQAPTLPLHLNRKRSMFGESLGEEGR